MTITLQDLQAKGACYWRADRLPNHDLAERVEQNLPATLDEILSWDWVPFRDRCWVAGWFNYTGQVIDHGCQSWWLNGERHRKDGPAVVDGDRQVWYLNGQLHREDGPAYVDGDCQVWYLYGKRLTKEEHAKRGWK